MPPKLIGAIIDKIAAIGNVSPTCEITMEANPTSVESQKFAAFKHAGINRVSLGIQSFNVKDLQFLGRTHSSLEATQAIEVGAKHFENYSFDLIYARPNQDLKSWRQELELAISLASKHISLYQLTIEKGTPFYSMYRKGAFSLPDQELALDLYDLTSDLLKEHGYDKYEISNYAKSGFESKHNLTYWNYGNYLGIGPGAHSRMSFYDNVANVHKMQAMEIIYNPQNWLNSVKEKGHGIKELIIIEQSDVIKEILMMGLRLTRGISNDKLLQFAGKPFGEIIDAHFISQLEEAKLLVLDRQRQYLSSNGLALHSRVISQMFENIKS
jgi:oxygen-independent coproporphyrinogen-3 oxidase